MGVKKFNSFLNTFKANEYLAYCVEELIKEASKEESDHLICVMDAAENNHLFIDRFIDISIANPYVDDIIRETIEAIKIFIYELYRTYEDYFIRMVEKYQNNERLDIRAYRHGIMVEL